MIVCNSSHSVTAKSAPSVQRPSDDRPTTSQGRRRNARYRIAAPLEYTLPGRERGTGYGTTTNVSSHGFLFQCDRNLPAGIRIEFWIEWPVRLNQQVGLRLYGTGSIVRTDGNYIAVETSRYEFRTRPASKALSMAAAR